MGHAERKGVEVICRVRPQQDSKISVEGDAIKIANERNPKELLSFTFAKVLGTRSSQADTFDSVKHIVDYVTHGKSATIFAYGQTGSGKTHSVIGTQQEPGIIPRVVEQLIARIKSSGGTLHASWLEVYLEDIYDLRDRRLKLDLQQSTNGTICVKGLSVVEINDLKQFQKEHECAWQTRITAATKLNEYSSRSHFVLQLMIRTEKSQGAYHAKLSICDLAGSEDNRKTGNRGERMKESGTINKSLFELGRVVDALNTKQQRIPYRNSKLTRLLQDSLGGKAIAIVLACLNGNDYSETLRTLQFAANCACIVNEVIVNEMKVIPAPKIQQKRLSTDDKENANVVENCPAKKKKFRVAVDHIVDEIDDEIHDTNPEGGSRLGPEFESLQKDTETRLLNILNKGTVKEIMTLKTIGQVRCSKIVSLREMMNGTAFKSLADLKPVFTKSQLESLFKANMQLPGLVE